MLLTHIQYFWQYYNAWLLSLIGSKHAISLIVFILQIVVEISSHSQPPDTPPLNLVLLFSPSPSILPVRQWHMMQWFRLFPVSSSIVSIRDSGGWGESYLIQGVGGVLSDSGSRVCAIWVLFCLGLGTIKYGVTLVYYPTTSKWFACAVPVTQASNLGLPRESVPTYTFKLCKL